MSVKDLLNMARDIDKKCIFKIERVNTISNVKENTEMNISTLNAYLMSNFDKIDKIIIEQCEF